MADPIPVEGWQGCHYCQLISLALLIKSKGVSGSQETEDLGCNQRLTCQ